MFEPLPRLLVPEHWDTGSDWLIELPYNKKQKRIPAELFPLAVNRIEMFFSEHRLKVEGIKTETGFRFRLHDSMARDLHRFVNISGSSLKRLR